MLILLPPSEKKRIPATSSSLELSQLSFAGDLNGIRKQILKGHPELLKCPTDQAISVYSGVLYQALDWESLDAESKRRGMESMLISSALFGSLRVSDLIPNYKIKVKPALWKSGLTAALNELENELIIDCRSSTYADMWHPDPKITTRIRVFEIRDGIRQVITHMSKKTRGEITKFLLQEVRTPRGPEELLTIVAKNFDSELVTPKKGKSWSLDVIVNQPN